jgi:hypothetical protein
MKKVEVIGFDPGYGDIKESFRNENGEIVNRKYSSLVAEASNEAVDMPLFEGKRYYMGNDALARSSDDIVEITDYMHLEYFSPLFLWKTLKENNIDINELKYIVSGLSFSQISKGPEFIKRLSRFKVNNESYDFRNRILLAPQGVGAKYAIDYYFPDGPKTYLIIDIGLSTIDTVDVINGLVRPENVHGYKDEGIIRIARNLQDYIAERFEEHISLKEVKEILETKSFFLEGEDHDLSEVIDEFAKSYTEVTLKTLKSRFEREFKKYRKIYFVGGGAHFIDKSLSKVIEVLPNPEYYNSIGNLLRGEQELQK